jgi:hypothetical protein
VAEAAVAVAYRVVRAEETEERWSRAYVVHQQAKKRERNVQRQDEEAFAVAKEGCEEQ